MNIPWWRTNILSEERASLFDAFDNKSFSYGKVAKTFERELCKHLEAKYSMATTSGSTALLIASQCMELKANDEVLIPNRTFHATAHAPMFSGAKIKLVDCRIDSPIVCLRDLEEKITPKTKVIYVTHLNGRGVEMDLLMEISNQYGVKVIEDAAQAFSSKYKGKSLGTYGDYGCFSFGMTKILSTGQGGAIVCNESDNLSKCQKFISHGVTDTQEDAFNNFGFNFRYCDLLAAIGREQLKKIDDKISYLKACYLRYEERLETFELVNIIPVAIEDGEVPIWMEVCSPKREWLMEKLLSAGVQTRKFLPSLEFSDYMLSGDRYYLPNSKIFHEQGMFLPFGPGITFDEIDNVCDILANL